MGELLFLTPGVTKCQEKIKVGYYIISLAYARTVKTTPWQNSEILKLQFKIEFNFTKRKKKRGECFMEK